VDIALCEGPAERDSGMPDTAVTEVPLLPRDRSHPEVLSEVGGEEDAKVLFRVQGGREAGVGVDIALCEGQS
jgi:hypothetical protein